MWSKNKTLLTTPNTLSESERRRWAEFYGRNLSGLPMLLPPGIDITNIGSTGPEALIPMGYQPAPFPKGSTPARERQPYEPAVQRIDWNADRAQVLRQASIGALLLAALSVGTIAAILHGAGVL